MALADLAKSLELRPDDLGGFRRISPAQVAACPNEDFRKGVLALADKTIVQLTGKPDPRQVAAAYVVRAKLLAAMKQPDRARLDFERAFETLEKTERNK